jgi:hypothetical protein
MINDQNDLFHPQILARSTSTRGGEPLKEIIKKKNENRWEDDLPVYSFF